MRLLFIVLLSLCTLEASWQDTIKKASLEYAQSKKNEIIADSNKKAIITLYKKLYPQLKNKSEKEALRKLATLGINVNKINSIASDLASGDDTKVRSATETLGVEFGQRLSKNLNDPYLRGKMQGLLGNVNEIKNISKILGEASAGDNKALYEYAATAFINAAGGGGVMSFYTTAHGVMKFAKDSYMDSTLEELYQKYKKGNLDKDDFDLQSDLGGYHTVIRDKIIEERKRKLEALGNVEISDELRRHLTQVSEADIKKEIFAGFEGRDSKEKNTIKEQQRLNELNRNTQAILEKLYDEGYTKYGKDWMDKKKYNLSQYVDIIVKRTKENPYLDPNNPTDLKRMSSLLATRMLYGEKSPEYAQALKNYSELMEIRKKGLTIAEDDPKEAIALFHGSIKGSWSGVSTGEYKFKAKGGFKFTISSSGSIYGRYWGDDSGTLSGQINASGNMNIKSGGGSAGSAKWSGSISRDPIGNLVGSGSFASKGWRGSWRGSGK